jgi:hypothetical protein
MVRPNTCPCAKQLPSDRPFDILRWKDHAEANDVDGELFRALSKLLWCHAAAYEQGAYQRRLWDFWGRGWRGYGVFASPSTLEGGKNAVPASITKSQIANHK